MKLTHRTAVHLIVLLLVVIGVGSAGMQSSHAEENMQSSHAEENMQSSHAENSSHDPLRLSAYPIWYDDIYGYDLPEDDAHKFKYYRTKAEYLGQMNFLKNKNSRELRSMLEENMAEEKSLAIPGIRGTELNSGTEYCYSNNYVPQGICKFDNYYIISGYENPEKLKRSVLYVLDRSWRLIKTITIGDYHYHNGGVTYDPDKKVVWLCGDTDKQQKPVRRNVYGLRKSTLLDAIEKTGSQVHIEAFDMDVTIGDRNKASCLDYHGGRLWVGTCVSNGNGTIVGYKINNKGIPDIKNTATLIVGKSLNGFTFDKNGDLYLSYSGGRDVTKTAKIVKYSLRFCPNQGKAVDLVSQTGFSVDVPKMNEEIMLKDDDIYILYESAADIYSNSNSEEFKASKKKEAYIITDRFTALPKKLWNEPHLYTLKTASEETEEVLETGVQKRISYEFNMAGQIYNTQHRLQIQPESSGEYSISITDQDDTQVLIYGEFLDEQDSGMGSFETADSNGGASEDTTYHINLVGGRTYTLFLSADSLWDESAYSGSFQVTLNRENSIAAVEVPENNEASTSVKAGESACFRYHPAETGLYEVSIAADGDLGETKVVNEAGEDVLYNGDYCELNENETYYFMTPLTEYIGETDECNVTFQAQPVQSESLNGSTAALRKDTVIRYEAAENGRQMIRLTGDDNAYALVYDETADLIAQGYDETVFNAEKGKTYQIICQNMSDEIELTITPFQIDVNNLKCNLTKKTFTYTGKSLKPAVSLYEDEYKLQSGKDYTVKYSNNTNAGTAKAVITGIGEYTGTSAKTFTIKKASQAITVKTKKKTVKAKKLKRSAKVVAPIIVKGAKTRPTYKIVSGSKKSKKALKLNKKTGKITVKKKTKKGIYKLRVKVTAPGSKNYLSKSKKVNVTVKVK